MTEPQSAPDETAESADPLESAEPDAPDTQLTGQARSPRAAQGETPLYKGEPLDSERGPGLGCFWIQASLLGILLILTPLTVAFAWPPVISAILLILTLLLLLFTGQTVIFLLRLVAADRRGRRTPRSATARKTVGMLEDESAGAAAADDPSDEPEEPVPAEPTERS